MKFSLQGNIKSDDPIFLVTVGSIIISNTNIWDKKYKVNNSNNGISFLLLFESEADRDELYTALISITDFDDKCLESSSLLRGWDISDSQDDPDALSVPNTPEEVEYGGNTYYVPYPFFNKTKIKRYNKTLQEYTFTEEERSFPYKIIS